MDIDTATKGATTAAEIDLHPVEKLLWRGVDYVLPSTLCSPVGTFWNIPSLLLNERTCMRAAVSRVLGLGIVVGAGLIKLPQIYNVLAAGSVAGLSMTSFHIDVFGYTYNLAAHYRAGYPISTYGDFVVLMLQNYILLYMCYIYTSKPYRGVAAISAFVGMLVLFCSDVIPIGFINKLTLLNVPVVFVGRLPQIYANYSNKSTGTLSAISSWGVFLGATARIFTTLQDVDSWNILYGYVASAVLNGIIAVQVLLYRGRKVHATPTAEGKKQL